MEGELTEIVETSCGKEVIAVGTTIYELSGVDFGSRELEVVDLSSGGCTIPTAPSSADCYRFAHPGSALNLHEKSMLPTKHIPKPSPLFLCLDQLHAGMHRTK